LIDETYGTKVERGVVIDVEAFDWNRPQHITERSTLAEIEPTMAELKARISQSMLRRATRKRHPILALSTDRIEDRSYV